MSTNDPVELLEGEDVIEWVRTANARAFRYKSNIPGAWFLVVVGMLSIGAAGYLMVSSRLALPIHVAGFSVLLLFTLWCWWTVFHWGIFTMRNYVAIGDTGLLIGRGAKAWVVPLSRLDNETIRFEDSRQGQYTSALPIHVDDHTWTVHLIGPFANLQGLQVFIAEILAHLMGDEDVEGEGPAEVGA